MPFELLQGTLGQMAGLPPTDMAAEANHRIANSLSLIAGLMRLQASSLSQNPRPRSAHEVRLILEECSGRIAAVAGLHRLLASPQQTRAVELAGYLRGIADAVVSTLSFAGNTRLHFALQPDCSVAPHRALTLGLIVGELITNAIKYAHPAGVAGEITIACHRGSAGLIVVEVSDDGVGLPEGLDPMKSQTLGLRVIRALAGQLGATMSVQDTGLGLSFVLEFPDHLGG